MRIDGQWAVFADGFVRPVIRGEVRSSYNSWTEVRFLVDTGADRTVFSAGVLSKLRLEALAAQDTLSGLGGLVDSVLVETEIQLTRETGGKVIFRGQFAAVTDLEALDISVLGRDITGITCRDCGSAWQGHVSVSATTSVLDSGRLEASRVSHRGRAWREILKRYPNSPEAAEARNHLEARLVLGRSREDQRLGRHLLKCWQCFLPKQIYLFR